MLKFIVFRLAASLFVICGSSVLVFCILYWLPGDAVLSRLALGTASPERIAEIRHGLGLDAPFYQQFGVYFGRMFRGDFGESLVSAEPVLPKIMEHVPATLALALTSTAISAGLGVLLGVWSAFHRGGAVDAAVRIVGLFGVSMPAFWSGIMLILLFSVRLGWLPPMGSDGVRTLILPSLTLGIVGTGLILRMVRSSVLDTIREPFIVTLRAKGLSERAVMYRHALRNALIPAVTMLGMLVGEMMAGAVVVETVFARQGIGRVLADAIAGKDLPVVQGVVVFSAGLYVLVNLLVDLSYMLIDPRIRRTGIGRGT
ncbi:ABC transporter permease [Cohnella caldifontis]|uniref:ABC transporter permease n=1 Tax=Cohnella caldifontis TaxID=3027471 RepID=UPI0023EB76FB|nr:ABC transporter permease [Cohnella sp. YIM B05605]